MPPTSTSTPNRETVIPRRKIESLIAAGRKIVIVEGRVLKVDAWLPSHPGGDKAVLHMVGRDATDEVRAFHSKETQVFMRKFQIGRIEGRWDDFTPPIQGGVFRGEEELEGGCGAAKQVVVEDEEEREDGDSSEEERSEQPSPVFDSNEHRTASLRRRRGSSGESSSTSLDTLSLDAPASTSRKTPLPPNVSPNQPEKELLHDLETYPCLDSETQSAIITKYRDLEARIAAAGLYNCNYSAYAIEALRYTTLALLSYYCLRTEHYYLSALFLGLFWHQLVFTVHDAGHMGITHNFQVDTCIGIFIADFLGGLSVCWWKRNHNVHHLVTNVPAHDPDIQHMPFFAVSPKFLESLRSTYYDCIMAYDSFAKTMLKYQHYLYYPLLAFGRFNLYVLSWTYLLTTLSPRSGPARYHRFLEIAGQIFFWYWFGYRLLYLSLPDPSTRLLYVLISHAITMPVHVQITLSHFSMSTSDLGVAESFPQRMLRTTMDVDCAPWLDFVHGGLQFQVVHHLFPRVPRHNLRRCQVLVREFCEEVEVPYVIYGFAEGNGKVLGRLEEVARLVRVMGECQKSMTVEDVLGHH